MSAAATAAGYLYASGRLRGRGAREQEHGPEEAKPKPDRPSGERAKLKRPMRVAVLEQPESAPAPRPKPAPRVEYRVRRWRPNPEPHE